jgi:hypothetical protein
MTLSSWPSILGYRPQVRRANGLRGSVATWGHIGSRGSRHSDFISHPCNSTHRITGASFSALQIGSLKHDVVATLPKVPTTDEVASMG